MRADRQPCSQISPLPGFDLEHFPFVACSDTRGIHLINLNRDYIEILVHAEAFAAWGQKSFFFTKEEYGMSLNFTHITKERDEDATFSDSYLQTKVERKMRLNWSRITFKPDFEATLRKIRRLPLSKKSEIITQ